MEEQSCWVCRYQDLEGETFLGRCTWFPRHDKGPAKDIPPNVVDVGCKFFDRRPELGPPGGRSSRK
jgi:hypothetical protein